MSLVDVPTGPLQGSWPIRELIDPAEIREAAEDVLTWGFGRPIDQSELDAGSWFRMGRGVVWWYEPPHPAAPEAALIHLAVAPRVRRRWPVRRWHVAAEVIAELMGATRLLMAPQDDTLRDYALRLGWKDQGLRLSFRLGG